MSLLREIKGAVSARFEPSSGESAAESENKPDVGFVACIEGGVLEAQALLLFESIRRYTGPFKNCSIYALSPRAGHGISRHAGKKLDKLAVEYSDIILNTECPEYGSANRVAAAAHIEATRRHDILVILDSDTIFLREPREFVLSPGVDAAVRPVDVKGISTSGRMDLFDTYWRDLCRCCGADYEGIPWGKSLIDCESIKANYNGGLVVVRSELGILHRWADFFFKSVREGLRPYADGPAFQAGAGWVSSEVGKFWGSNQAALSVAIWSTSTRVQELPMTYNYPLHLHSRIDPALAADVFPSLVHVHYHWLFGKDSLSANPLFLRDGPLSEEQRAWLCSATPLS